MKKKYSDTLPMLKELFPDWKDEDLVFALEDSNGELEEAIERITEGRVPLPSRDTPFFNSKDFR
jgi:hypothetical protein